jgi:hypothetical protein
MILNYHEMTMNEPRDSPARRQQFKVICTIMAGMFIHSVITAGAFMTIHIKEGVFPGENSFTDTMRGMCSVN